MSGLADRISLVYHYNEIQRLSMLLWLLSQRPRYRFALLVADTRRRG